MGTSRYSAFSYLSSRLHPPPPPLPPPLMLHWTLLLGMILQQSNTSHTGYRPAASRTPCKTPSDWFHRFLAESAAIYLDLHCILLVLEGQTW